MEGLALGEGIINNSSSSSQILQISSKRGRAMLAESNKRSKEKLNIINQFCKAGEMPLTNSPPQTKEGVKITSNQGASTGFESNRLMNYPKMQHR